MREKRTQQQTSTSHKEKQMVKIKKGKDIYG